MEDIFVSLCPETGVQPSLDVATWSLNGSFTGEVVRLGNAHTPEYFGPVAEASDNTTEFVTAVVHNGLEPVLARWAIALFDINGTKSSMIEISPRIVGETASVAGLGVSRN